VTAYQPAAWHDLFTATAAAAAALAGLIFVAVSINLAQILRLANLPRRAVETLAIAVGLLLVPRLQLRRNRGGIAVNAWILLVEIQR